MVLSSERESMLIQKNMPKIYRSVDNFMARYKGDNWFSYDDFVQEVSVVFLKYIRRCETEEQLEHFPWYDSMHAMTDYVLRSQPLSLPETRKSFYDVMSLMPETISFEVWMSKEIDVDGMSRQWVQDTDTKLDFESFMSSQKESVQRIASMRLYGMTQRDIAAQFGVCKRAIDKKITRLREKYDEFTKEDEDSE